MAPLLGSSRKLVWGSGDSLFYFILFIYHYQNKDGTNQTHKPTVRLLLALFHDTHSADRQRNRMAEGEKVISGFQVKLYLRGLYFKMWNSSSKVVHDFGK